MRAVIALVVMLVVGGIIGAAVYVQKSQVAKEQAVVAGPPADAKFIEAGVTPQQVIAGIQRKNAAPSHYIGMWVPEPGWDMGVDDVSPSSDGGLGRSEERRVGKRGRSRACPPAL